jgi:hypothetical protein|tara:strand:+ start:596 stop:835 length:240 start_codon:yes stop_codon:yes gene_type:complete
MAEKDVYSEEGREDLVDNDEISSTEEGFMEGADGDGQGAKCRKCGKLLLDDVVEKEINGEVCRFCSGKCADGFGKGKEE